MGILTDILLGGAFIIALYGLYASYPRKGTEPSFKDSNADPDTITDVEKERAATVLYLRHQMQHGNWTQYHPPQVLLETLAKVIEDGRHVEWYERERANKRPNELL